MKMANGGTGWRKIAMGVVAALLPLILKAIKPDLETAEIVAAVMGLLGAIIGVAWQDVAKEKRAAMENIKFPKDTSGPE